ncbi:hypothetical protein CLAFUW4_04491 [Fulvia fulva]|uniref:Fungal N-terminal domain-containing protein n=1 Tax=Passalora fulva TaxID=5499 RepID=A0A9Q8LGL7_PASFU|nr:uncharacterized protein CLAFUR5_04456 [Fulvia fulva]KAK4626325.1 hypothetical protein CLAFUR4_04477 [Fulvia fulva]KAK4628005.1 hypothetical protein CLAFUR0_04480 [Fulvia fulva]UJO16794.1 hypothetical protein CLAFUR5_04456 [Fulvia fulva]WPV14193.1 hypothetical protein CLAFUW4_04491 [Fulvia fulva]WPV28992.1 hypothetical protein CLAFUW7_04483 [Fulvia fulva]
MDAIGSVSAVLGIALFALSIAKQLHEVIDIMKDAPDSVMTIARDAHDFHAIMESLHTILTERSVNYLVERHPTFRQQVENLKRPIQHCCELVSSVTTELQLWFACQSGGIKKAAKRVRFYDAPSVATS